MATPLPGLLEGAATCSVCGGPCIGFPPDGPVLWQKGEPMPPEELIYLGRKVHDANGVLLFGTYDGIPKSKAEELGLVPATPAEPAPKSAKATPVKSRARKPAENR